MKSVREVIIKAIWDSSELCEVVDSCEDFECLECAEKLLESYVQERIELDRGARNNDKHINKNL